jgi:pyridoxal 5'-phosphate synthase pdxS subunit
MIRSKGEAGSGNIVEAVRHMRAIRDGIAELSALPPEELVARARNLGAPLELVREVAREKRLPVVLFCAGGIATPADAALMMQLGAEGLFVGSGIFKSNDPKTFARAIVDATTHFDKPEVVLEACRRIGKESEAMHGLDLRTLRPDELLAVRGS